jgi:hypothetical protein
MSMRRREPAKVQTCGATTDTLIRPMAGLTEAQAAQFAFEQLSPTQQQAASLGVDPNSLKPLSEPNMAHYQTLREQNKLSPELVRQLEAYSILSAQEEKH